MKKKHGIIFVFVLAIGVALGAIVNRTEPKPFFAASDPSGVEMSESTPDFSKTDADAKDQTVISDDSSEKRSLTVPTSPSLELQETRPSPKTPELKTKGNDNGFEGSIRDQLVDFGFSVPSNPRTIDTIVLHSSYDAIGSDPYSVSGVIAEWQDAGVSPHYLIDRDGIVRRLVKDEDIAFHAGVSQVPDGRKNVNGFSIGIEIIGALNGTYTDKQYASVNDLLVFLKSRYAIKYVLGHDDIAPGRKTDPWNLDWNRLDGLN